MEKEVVLSSENGITEFHYDDDDDNETWPVHINGDVKENENPNVDFLEDLDSYWDDVNDRLTISRVVNDSIFRGMVTAIESEAAERISQKDNELSRIKETLHLYHVGSEETEAASVGNLKTEARKQLFMLVEELTNLRKYIHVTPHETDKSKTLDKILDSLRNIIETRLKRKNGMDEYEHECVKEIESSVLTSVVASLRTEYEQRLLDQKAEFGCGNNKSLILGNVKEIAGLRNELELIRKSLLDHESGDIEVGDKMKMEQLHRKMSGSLTLDNGKHEESKVEKETLKHLSQDELISHFKTEMNKIKRDHDYEVQRLTEECFTYKRKYLNLQERGSFNPLGKDHKEIESLKKMIPAVIKKLDNILMEDDKKSVSEGKNHQMDSLLMENRQLKDSLSDSAGKISQLYQAKTHHQELIRKLESDNEDSHVEASIYEDVYRCFVTESVGQIKYAKEEKDLQFSTMKEAYELLLEDVASKERESKDEFEDSCIKSLLMEECCGIVYEEALKEAHKKIVELNTVVTEREGTLRAEMVDKERLKEEIHWLECLVKEKDELIETVKSNLSTEKSNLKVVSHQIKDLKDQIEQQRNEIKDMDEALSVATSREVEKTESYEEKISNLREEVEAAKESLKEIKDETRKTEEKLSSTKTEKEMLKKEIELATPKLINSFNILEGLIVEKTQKSNARLRSMQSQLSDLSYQMKEVKGKASTYKQRLEKKCCDLQKAEAEVDVLGDEVESLLELLEKIYITLDHYSPILKHYPGIIEILKLVRREISGESKRILD